MQAFEHSQAATLRLGQGGNEASAPPSDAPRSTDFVDIRELQAWSGVFDRLDVPHALRVRIAECAHANQTSIQAEFLAYGLVREQTFYRYLATDLGLDFAPTVEPADIMASEKECLALLKWHRTPAPRLRTENLSSRIVIATDHIPLHRMKRFLAEHPALRERLLVAPRQAMRSALLDKCRETLSREAVHGLFARRPDLSARFTVNGWQGYAVAALNFLSILAFVLFPERAWLGLHIAVSFFFLGCVGLRAIAIARTTPNKLVPIERTTIGDLPVYSVLVALHDEAEIVPELLVALGSILWPRSKLEIKLVCEEDDHKTLAALRAQPLRPWVEIIEVPRIGPRTKPKALSFALPATSGEFVVLYDAEDRPHPSQLLEAWQTFRKGSPQLACLQAPLEISNREHNLITRLFGVEYSALFNGLLPFLSKSGLPLPLGGTSNHFRRNVLEEVGGWDPYNVTEDADLGVRLARFGYRTGTITRPTFEPAPDSWSIWVPQRARWFKGWCQTWLVHMRAPGRLWSEIGTASFWTLQILFAGLILSALAHPLMLGTLGWSAYNLSNGIRARHRPFDHLHHRRSQHHAELRRFPAARLAHARTARPKALLESRAVHAALLDGDVRCRHTGDRPAGAQAASLGQDPAFPDRREWPVLNRAIRVTLLRRPHPRR